MLVFYIVFTGLCFRGGGSCGGGPLYTLGGVTGSGGIVWTSGGESTLGCAQAGSCWGNINGTFGSFIVICGVGDASMRHTGAVVWKKIES